jgi:SAM-dependent methyltransferase
LAVGPAVQSLHDTALRRRSVFGAGEAVEERMAEYPEFPHLDRYCKVRGAPPENVVRAYHIEREFHEKILREPDPAERRRMYEEVYSLVHPLYQPAGSPPTRPRSKDERVRFFRRELEGKSVLDLGCGTGQFLMSVAKLLDHGRLVGIDVSVHELPKDHPSIRFIAADIIRFEVDEKFDVVFSDQVMEHIAPADLHDHLVSIRRALVDGGALIVMMPNRLFGPSDVTGIVDFTHTNRVPACGTHLNESTYSEMIPLLKEHGFRHLRTMLPKLRTSFPGVRISPSLLTVVEKSPWLLKLMYKVRRNGQCALRSDVVLICR